MIELTENMQLIKPLLNEPMSNWPAQNEANVKTLDATLYMDYGEYSPQWKGTLSDPVLGNGQIKGRRLFLGNRYVTFWLFLQVGSTTTFGDGTYSLTLPVETNVEVGSSFGSAYLATTSSFGNSDTGTLRLRSSTEVEIVLARTGAGIWSSSNITNRVLVNSGDYLHVVGTYTRSE